MNVPLYQKIEIAFWDVAIDFLTQSHTTRYLIRKWVELKRSRNYHLYLSIVATGGILGFLLGFGLPLFLNSIP